MKYAFSLIVLLFSAQAFAGEPSLGLGFIIGDPTALSVKYYRSEESAFDAGLSIVHNDYVIFWGDHLYHYPAALGRQKLIARISPYFGFGVIAAIASKSDHPKGNFFDKRKDRAAVGVRIPVGVEFIWDKVPIGIGLELVPGVIVAPATMGALQGGLSLRYYF